MRRRLEAAAWEAETEPLTIQGSELLEVMPDPSDAANLPFTPVSNGEEFGPVGGGFKYRVFRVQVPPSATEIERYLLWDCDGEATVFIGGQPWAGLDIAHRYCRIPSEELDLIVPVGTYQRGIWTSPDALPAAARCRFRRAHTATRNPDRWSLSWDFEILAQLMDHHLKRAGGGLADGPDFHEPLDRAPVALRKLLARLDKICDRIDMDDLPGATALLAEGYAEFPGSPADGHVALVGHSHLDQVWLWPERVTYDKAIHTTATALQLMERYPELVYSQSTPHQYDALRARSPDLWQQVCRLIEEGRWEATGGMYVESDVNLPSGEGLARSLLFGQHHFSSLTGSPSTVLWLPDVFGYPSCLPQLMRLSGITSFYTTKLSWSTITRFPYTVFNWRSPDGSWVVASQSPVGYNEPVSVESLSRCIELHKQTGVHDTVLLSVGYGDGGGGVTDEMIESARRLRSLGGVPSVSWTTAEGYFSQLAEKAGELPVYEGELYLEYHRGTLTTHSDFKQRYRACERAFQLREAVRAVTGMGPLGLEEWRRLLFVQFHDALPGSSIAEVYTELTDELAVLEHDTMALAVSELESACGSEPDSPRAPAAARWVFNPVPLPRVVLVEGESASASGVVGLARCSGAGLFPVTEAPREGLVTATANLLENNLVRAEFNERGMLSALSVRGHQLELRDTRFILCRDYPVQYDAWEIDYSAPELSQPVLDPVTLSVTERTAFRGVLEGHAEFGNGSSCRVRYLLTAECDHLMMELDIDWHEDHRLLQYEVGTGYRGRDAIYGEPFGSIRRRQVPGFPSDVAKWEVPGQRWAAVCNDTATEGIAVVTQAHYGFSCDDGALRLSLLRAPTDPDATADRGRHTIRFAIGAFRTHGEGAILSTPATAESLFAEFLFHGELAEAAPAGSLRGPVIHFEELGSLTPSWIKPAEDGSGLILRLHECAGMRGDTTLVMSRGLVGGSAPAVLVTDLLERAGHGTNLVQLDSTDDSEYRYPLPYGPYQIITLKVETPGGLNRH